MSVKNLQVKVERVSNFFSFFGKLKMIRAIKIKKLKYKKITKEDEAFRDVFFTHNKIKKINT